MISIHSIKFLLDSSGILNQELLAPEFLLILSNEYTVYDYLSKRNINFYEIVEQ